jgi:large subunit ribosomal protein L28
VVLCLAQLQPGLQFFYGESPDGKSSGKSISYQKEEIIMKCELCQKKMMSGHNVSHSMRHTKRQWKPNVQKTTVFKGGRAIKMKLCSRCLRTAAKG